MGIEEQFPGVDGYDVLNFDRRKTRLETVLLTLFVSPREVFCLWLYLKDGVLTLDQFSPRL